MNVVLHQGSVLTSKAPLPFLIVMEVIAEELWEGLLWELLYANYLILIAANEESLHEKIVQEAQLPLRNRASSTYFFVAKLISIAHSCV